LGALTGADPPTANWHQGRNGQPTMGAESGRKNNLTAGAITQAGAKRTSSRIGHQIRFEFCRRLRSNAPRLNHARREAIALAVMTAIWILFCSLLSCAGWGLSLLGMLNKTGYVLIGVGAIAAMWFWRKELGGRLRGPRYWGRVCRRSRRLFPAAFFGIVFLVALGGLLHAPSNYDGLAYRTPRVLHWLAEGQWHWIHTDFERLNTRATGYEWVTAPFLLFTHSVRPVFLIGLISFLLLPGLVFGVLTRLGVAGRVAWHWMWLAPTGYCFALQAGGIGNDVYGATLALAAFNFALRARTSRAFADVALALLAAGLMTAAKTSNIPLLFPCVIAGGAAWRVLLLRPVASLALLLVVGLVSFLPIAVLNHRQCGDWTGAKAEEIALAQGDPRVTIPGNLVILTIQNLVPPVFPMAKQWNEFAPKLWPGDFHQAMLQNFERGGANLLLPELQNEEAAGLGFGVSLLLVISIGAGWWLGRKPSGRQSGAAIRWVRRAPWVALAAYLYKATFSTAARIIAPYYLLLLPIALAGKGQDQVCRQPWWRWLAMLVFGLTALLLIITPSRPLWPATTVLSRLNELRPGHPLLQRALTVYSVYGIRAAGLAPVREKLPAAETEVGLVTFDDLETSLWQPFGQRRFRHIAPRDTPEDVSRLGLRYAVLNGEWFPSRTGLTVEEWLTRFNATLEATIPLQVRAGRGKFNWYVVRFEDAGGTP
jgi:hypothetical protein